MTTREIHLSGSPDQLRVAELLLTAFDLACRHDLQPLGGGRTAIDRQNAAVSLLQWALGQKADPPQGLTDIA
jgi:hypothetical protein